MQQVICLWKKNWFSWLCINILSLRISCRFASWLSLFMFTYFLPCFALKRPRFSLIDQIQTGCISDVEWSNKRSNATLPASATHSDGILSLKDSHCHDNSLSGRGLSAGILIRADLQHKPKPSRMSLIIKPWRPRTDAQTCFVRHPRWTKHAVLWSNYWLWTHDAFTACVRSRSEL